MRSLLGFTLGVVCTVGVAAVWAKWAAEDWVKGVR
jgi:hypothetical protein